VLERRGEPPPLAQNTTSGCSLAFLNEHGGSLALRNASEMSDDELAAIAAQTATAELVN
jgi:hypothetical protein